MALGGAVVLLLIGTQILDWYWLVILFAGSFGFGVWRTMQRLPSRYALAQQIDERMGLYDAVSTAYNFENSERRAPSEELREMQRAEAEAAARRVDLVAAFPFVMPKTMYFTGGIALVAFGMFALRYGVTRSLDLRPSLVKIAFDTFFQPNTQTADAKKSPWRQKLDEELKKLGINMNATDAKPNDLEPTPDSALAANDSPEGANSGEPDTAKSKTSSVPNEKESGESGGDEKSERASPSGADKGGADQPPEGNDGQPQNGQQASTPKGGKESNGQNSSLMDKMRDAMSNLMNKLKMNSKQGESKQDAQNSQQGSQSQQQGKGEKGQMAGKQQSNGSEQQDQSQQQAQGDQSQSAKGKSGDKDANQQASQDSKSGVGKQDGDKSAREAEQLAAMGKISEILGKRAKDMSGEVMVEVSSGKQQLKTQYSSNNSTHVEAGNEIRRDEVPIEYQEYVQHYFEQIRKLPAPAAAKK